MARTKRGKGEGQLRLYCRRCGNDQRFAEIMEYEVHFVNANLDYVRLACAEVDFYRCAECGVIVKPRVVRAENARK